MGSSIDGNDRRNTNCIKQSNRSYENLEFRQYDENENIIYYYRKQNNFSSDHAFFVYDKNEKIIIQLSDMNSMMKTKKLNSILKKLLIVVKQINILFLE